MGLLMLNGIPYSGFTEPSNIYSTTEREVGVWIDGKPLYEITLSYHESSPVASKTYDISSLGIEFVLLGEKKLHFGPNGGNGWADVPWYESNLYQATIRVSPTQLYAEAQGWLFVDVVATIYYTKTSDVPGSGKYAPDGSVMHHYSSDEHVIGTWINGKTLYEKTALISNIQVPSNNYALITLSDYFSNVSKVINYECMTDTGDPIPKIYIDSSDAPYSTSAIIELYSDAIIFSRGGGGSTTFNAYVTLRYTKSS